MPKPNPLRDDHRRFEAVLREAARLRWRKLNDYGASYRNFGAFGVAVRMGDKMARLTRLMQAKRKRKVDESLRDTALDLLNYSAMLAMLLEEERGKGC